MTEQLQSAWKTSSKPFHHETLFTEDFVPIVELQAFVSSIVRYIALYYPNNALFLFDDWHAHDGFIVQATPISIGELTERVGTVDSLYTWRQGDTEVYRSIYPETFDFLFRVYVCDKDEDPEHYPGIWGSLSFTGYGIDVAEIRKRGHDVASLKLAQMNSKSYFDQIYSG